MRHIAILLLAMPLAAQVHIEISVDDHGYSVSSSKSVEVLELQINGPQRFRSWLFDFNRPIVEPGKPHQSAAPGGVTSVEVLSVGYSDGSGNGDAECWRVRRDEYVHGGPVHPDACSSGAAGNMYVLHRMYQRAHPGMPDPEIVRGPVSETSYPWFNAGSMTSIWTTNGVPDATSPDWAGNPEWTGGCAGPCTIFGSETARCPSGSGRTSLSASIQVAATCYNTFANGSGSALYGPDGLGSGDPTQRWGIIAYGELEYNGVIGQGNMTDSCGLKQPESSGNIGGYCRN